MQAISTGAEFQRRGPVFARIECHPATRLRKRSRRTVLPRQTKPCPPRKCGVQKIAGRAKERLRPRSYCNTLLRMKGLRELASDQLPLHLRIGPTVQATVGTDSLMAWPVPPIPYLELAISFRAASARLFSLE